jgi:hypothetical protein
MPNLFALILLAVLSILAAIYAVFLYALKHVKGGEDD